MLIDKYNSYILDKLPAKIADELKIIASDTDNFQDEEMNAIYSDNFNELHKIIKDKYPEAIKQKKKLITKVKPKIVKKAKPKIVKKATPKPTLKVVKGVKDKPAPAPADPKNEEIDCEEAIKTIKKQEKHKKEVAEKRAEAPKKSDSTFAREHMVKMFSHFLNKTKWKSDRAKSEKLAKHIIAGISEDEPELAAAATKELDELIEKHFNPKLEEGGKIPESNWEAQHGEITNNGKHVSVYEFDRDSDSFWTSESNEITYFKNKPVFENGGKIVAITPADITPDSKFEFSDGTIFIVDSLHDDEDGTQVRTSIAGGKKGNYKDPLNDVVDFFNENQAIKTMERGGKTASDFVDNLVKNETLEEKYTIIRKWSDDMIDDKDIDSVLNALVSAGVTDSDLHTKPTKTGSQYTKALDSKSMEIFQRMEKHYYGRLKGYQPLTIIHTLVDRATRYNDNIIERFESKN